MKTSFGVKIVKSAKPKRTREGEDDMGIEYYAAIPEWKTLWYLGKHICNWKEMLDVLEVNWKRLCEASEEFKYNEILTKKPTEITSLDWAEIFSLLGKMMSFNEMNLNMIFLMILKKRGIKFHVINDMEGMEKYENWKRVTPWGKEEE